MDGDSPNLEELVRITEKHHAYLVIDEAHALGVFGEKGEGLIQSLGLQNKVFARIMTFGKGLGCHGAAILGSQELKSYLVNFARSFIYTTGLSPHSVATIFVAYQHLTADEKALITLKNNIVYFNQEKLRLGLKPLFVYSKSAIQCAIIPGNSTVKDIASQLQQKGLAVAGTNHHISASPASASQGAVGGHAQGLNRLFLCGGQSTRAVVLDIVCEIFVLVIVSTIWCCNTHHRQGDCVVPLAQHGASDFFALYEGFTQ
jgi:hypothetical protein